MQRMAGSFPKTSDLGYEDAHVFAKLHCFALVCMQLCIHEHAHHSIPGFQTALEKVQADDQMTSG